MRNRLFTSVSIAIVCLFVPSARADDCICAKLVMYPVAGGWFHYAVVCNRAPNAMSSCTDLYGTGLVNATALPTQNCSFPACGDCATLAQATPPLNFNFTTPLRPYDQVDTTAEFIAYLEATAGRLPGQVPEYRFWTFSEPKVLSLTRTANNAAQTFYAVMWKMQDPNNPGVVGYIGVEISNPGTSTPIGPFAPCNAVHTAKQNGIITHTPVKGIVQVNIDANNIGFVRLNSASNAGVTYPTCVPGSARSLKMSAVAPAVEGLASAAPAPSYSEVIFCRKGRRYYICQPWEANVPLCCARARRSRCRNGW